MSHFPCQFDISRRLPAAILLCAVLHAPVAQAPAAESRAQLGVSAVVLAMARLTLSAAPRVVEVSAADVRRGFVDVPQPAALFVQSNSAAGFQLDLQTLDPMVRGLVVEGLDSPQVLGAEGGTLVRRWNAMHAERLALRFRLMLAPDLAPGRYPWPLRFAVRPL